MPKLISLLLPTAFLLAPIFIFIIYFLPNQYNKIKAWMSVGASLTTFISLLFILPYSFNGIILESSSLQFTPNVDLFFKIDLFGVYFGLISSLIWLLASFYSIGYMEDSHYLSRFYCFFTLCLYFTLGIAFAGNLFTLFIFYELVTLSGYTLIVHEETEEARYASKKYLYYTLFGDAFVLFTIFMSFHTFGSLNFKTIAETGFSGDLIDLQILIFSAIIGFGVKAAIMPLHSWVTDAHPAAPSPASAILSGVLVNVGIFGIARIFFNILGMPYLTVTKFEKILIPIVIYTIIAASIIAINQDNLKRRLAYSTIGQLGYIIFGFLMFNQNGLIGSLTHIINHALMKATLFMCAGAIIKTTGKKNVSELNGIGRKMPITMTIFTIAALGMIGVPPLCGFVSKWMLGLGALDANEPLYILVFLVSSLLSSVYFLPIIYKAFFLPADDPKLNETPQKWYKECSLYMLFSMSTGAILIIVLGIFTMFPGSPLQIATKIAQTWIQ